MKCIIDGGYDNIRKRNPYCSVKIYGNDGELVYYANRVTVKATTNNQAEYQALILCLKYLTEYAELGYHHEILSDSRLLVEQVNCNWQVRDTTLQYLWKVVHQHKLPYSLIWVPRSIIVKELGH